MQDFNKNKNNKKREVFIFIGILFAAIVLPSMFPIIVHGINN